MNAEISVIICTRNRPKEIENLLKSLHAQTRMADEILVVDSSNDEKTREIALHAPESIRQALRYVRCEPGLTKQRNFGIGQSRGAYLLFLDDDTIAEEKYVENVIQTFEMDSQIAGVTGRITNLSGGGSSGTRLIKKLFFLIDRGKGRLKLSGFPEHCMGETMAFVEVCSGACMSFGRRVFDGNLFDENLSGYSYMEDVDFSFRVSRSYKMAYQPLARVAHYPSTYKTIDSRSLRRMMVRNHTYLFNKNQPKDIAHLYGFAMSILGLLLFNGILNRDLRACVGIIEGLWDSFHKKHACAFA